MDTLSVNTFSNLAELEHLWKELAQTYSNSIHGDDFTSSYDWHALVHECFLDSAPISALLHHEGGTFLPLYHSDKRVCRVNCTAIAPISMRYSGRTSFPIRQPDAHVVMTLLNALQDVSPRWDVFLLRVVEGSVMERAFCKALKGTNFSSKIIDARRTPYIELPTSWDKYLKERPKKFRWHLKRCQELVAGVTYEHFDSTSDPSSFLEALTTIENSSWKHSAGSSITTNPDQDMFYRKFVAATKDKSWFSGHLLRINGVPASFIYGVEDNGIFYDLKESFDEGFKEHSPGHLLKVHTIKGLISRGIKLYDFMGFDEPYKLRWTDQSYTQNTYAVFNHTWRGRLSSALGYIQSLLPGR